MLPVFANCARKKTWQSLVCLTSILASLFCSLTPAVSSPSPTRLGMRESDITWVGVAFDPSLPETWTRRYLHLLRQVAKTEVVALSAESPTPLEMSSYRSQIVLSIGRTRIQREHFGESLKAQGTDSYSLQSIPQGRLWLAGVSAGSPLDRGLLYGAYHLLEELGFAFLHPFGPEIPNSLLPPLRELHYSARARWQERGIHIHTQHPTELVDFLNGWGTEGPYDAAGWSRFLELWEQVCEWAVANRLNQLQWALLADKPWARFADGKIRRDRLERIVAMAHAFSLRVGIDTPLFLRQQNAFRLIRNPDDRAHMERELSKRLDYLMSTGIDFLMTELGTSEFTPADETLTIELLNHIADQLERRYGHKFLSVKVHASAHQQTKNLKDPETGEPFNVNFLPMLADPRIVLMPHTVQFYSLTDPAPTYGQKDFSFLRTFMRKASRTHRLWWFPETAYWVSFDIDIPLFLPLYAWKRLEDLELIADDEDAGRLGSSRLGGQTFFSSGWEWGYWLNDLITARASYEGITEGDRRQRLSQLLQPLLRLYGSDGMELLDRLLTTMQTQERWLIQGGLSPEALDSVSKRNGQAYLQGFETWDDMGQWMAGRPLPQIAHQPLKYTLQEMEGPEGETIAPQILPLLAGMQRDFQKLVADFEPLLNKPHRHHPRAQAILQELYDGLKINALRAEFIHQLYLFADQRRRGEALSLRELDLTAGATLKAAELLLAQRAQSYRLPVRDIASWRPNPTVYAYTYLWTAQTLYYWRRDYLMLRNHIDDPCYANIIDPIATSGLNKVTNFYGDSVDLLSQWLQRVGFENCLRVPEFEPRLPR